MSTIQKIAGYELIDSRGNPTVACKVVCSGGYRGFAIVPSGASTGEHEAFELRDNESRYLGKGVTKAIDHIHGPISDLLLGKDIFDQKGIDLAMIKLDGTENKSKLGANAILGVSMAVARCAAAAKGIELYQYLSTGKVAFPTPMMNIINGGMHANNNIDFQELMISPHGFDSFKEKIRAGSEIFHSLKKILKKNNHITSVGDEGGFAPNLSSVEEALDMIIDAIKASHYKPGEQVSITLDCAASSFYMSDGYFIEKTHPEKGMRSSKEQVHYLKSLTEKYPISSIEDGLDENDWEGWQYLTKECGNIQLVGDDIFVTNIKFLKQAIEKKVGNCILIKPNQIGTVTETLETIAYAKKHGYSFIISHRSGDTEDTFIADLSLATCAPEIKTGSMSRSERIAKYNRLLEIEKDLSEN